MLYYIIVCYVMLCYVMLCYVILYYIILYYIILYYLASGFQYHATSSLLRDTPFDEFGSGTLIGETSRVDLEDACTVVQKNM